MKPADLDLDDSVAARQEAAQLWQRLEAAAAQPGFSGDLRRAIDKAAIPAHHLATECGIDVNTLQAFRCGDGELPTDVVNRLLAVLGLTLRLVSANSVGGN